jgi:NitT/TauT family transport system substrate-binding protein
MLSLTRGRGLRRRLGVGLVAVVALLAFPAGRQGAAEPRVPAGFQAKPDRLILQLSDVRQAEFAGYYVAQALGYYRAARLDVSIVPGVAGGEAKPPAGHADVWSAWLPQALAAREHGLKLVNFAQMFPHSGLELVCRKASNIHSPADLKGRTVGVWQDGAQIPFLAWMRKLGLSVPGDVTMLATPRLPDRAAVAPLLDRDAACVTALNYDQYWALIDAGMMPWDLQPFHYGDAGVATLQDGLYATETSLDDPARADALVRFLRASVQGWKYAVAHQSEAVGIVLDSGRTSAAPPSQAEVVRQTRMLSAVARLTESGLQAMGYLEPAAYDRTVQLLLQSGAMAPISHPPEGGWTHAIWERARH